MIQLQDIRAFVEVGRSGSFVRAAEILQQSSSAISKAVSRLETHLDVRLFQRSTRYLALTEEGTAYLANCLRILDELERANDEVSQRRTRPNGQLRVHFPLLWARDVVIPVLPEFQQRYPEVNLQLVFSESRVEFADGYDVIVLVGDKDLGHDAVVRKLKPTHSIIAAAPDYLGRKGMPLHPRELNNHECICFMMADAQIPIQWNVLIDGRLESFSPESRIALSDPHVMVAAAASGLGVIQGPDILIQPYIDNGQLVQLLAEFSTAGPDVCMAWPKNRYMSLRLRVFIDWLSEVAARDVPVAPLSLGAAQQSAG